MGQENRAFGTPEDTKAQFRAMEKIKAKNSGTARYCYVETLGCQQNHNDSERILGMLSCMGYAETKEKHHADVIVFNTCAVREHAEKKLLGKIGTLKGYKEAHPNAILIAAGCMTQQPRVSRLLKEKYKHVDIVIGTHNLYRLPTLMLRVMEEHKNVHEILDTDGFIVEGMPVKRETNGVSAWVSIMYGCNNFCSYCIVPYVRGRERSRLPEDILRECRELVQEGYREITLLGQNVNSYGKDFETPYPFADLLEEVSQVEGLMRLRFISSHPKDMSEAVLDVMARHPNICNCLHLPVQSGSDQVLAKMNRRYTRKQYLDIIRAAKEKMPDIMFSTDIIVGFPTETDSDFEDTLSLIKEVRYQMIFSFIYSKRSGTPAAEMEAVMQSDEIQKNFDRLLKEQEKIAEENNQRMVGKTLSVLVEEVSKTNPDKLTGRTEYNQLVHFTGNQDLIGSIIPIHIDRAGAWALSGTIKEKGDK